MSAIAQRAGVERLTVYRHFPDARSLLAACSAHWMAANPPPDVSSWSSIRGFERRIRQALEELYSYYRRTEPMMSRLQRDKADLPELAELMTGFDDLLGAALQVLSQPRLAPGRRGPVRASIIHALRFETWQSLSAAGLDDPEAAELMSRLVRSARRR